MNNPNGWKKTVVAVACLTVFAGSGLAGFGGAKAASAATTQTVSASAVSASALTASQKADKIIALAKSLKGKVTYKFNVNNSSKLIFDCSSFTKYVFGKYGVSLPWSSKKQALEGTYVSKSNLKKGDLIFLSVSGKSGINHVGIYIGDGKFIHNTIGSNWNGLLISDINSSTYSKRYITARRVL
ncbi:C40 family peptidase [Cohnella fermenti]|uniref:NlpC/P60 family protein n=1 Tax=Cohnella fermenti TaxID=2565925 RepID=A0A4S4C9V6_9BACL|nr:C40 family peptidase [Cohnella fermenti]THF84191.1 NlpC/P60 family protein [Cohnella fermenti]